MDVDIRRIRAAAVAIFCFILTFQLWPVFSESRDMNNRDDRAAIGTAIFIKREAKDIHRFLNTHRPTLPTDAVEDGGLELTPELLIRKGSPFGRREMNRGIPRALKYAGACREDTNHVEAIVECSNAVRQDPDFFAKDYPCGYNQWRGEVVGKKRPLLRTGATIQRLAQLHTDDQARMNSMSHTGSDGSNLQTRADRIKLPWGAVGENVAVGFSNAKAVIGVGAGISHGGRNYYTQVFSCGLSESCGCSSSPSPSSATASATASATGSATATATATATSKGRGRSASAPHQRPAGSHASASSNCDWINAIWTCGQNVHPKQADPYDVASHQHGYPHDVGHY